MTAILIGVLTVPSQRLLINKLLTLLFATSQRAAACDDVL